MPGKGEIEYLVRGAILRCRHGSHSRRLNLTVCHGVYAYHSPVIRENDCIAGTNITSFGICNGPTPPSGAETIQLVSGVVKGSGKAEEIQGLKCCPEIIGSWRNVHMDTRIDGDFAAVTMDSYLVCRHGGIIQPETSGYEYKD